MGYWEENFPKKPVGRQLAKSFQLKCRPPSGQQSADSR